MKKIKFGILCVIAVLALVSIASADTIGGTMVYPSDSGHFFDIHLDGGTNAPLWCIELDKFIYNHYYTFQRYSSLDPVPVGPSVNWHYVNYIMNYPVTPDGTATWKETQAAIWRVMGYSPALINGEFSEINWDIVNDLVANAQTNGASFVPGPGQSYAIVLYIADDVQMVFYTGIVPSTPAPEFPTLALPAGMLVGMIGAVYAIKGREN